MCGNELILAIDNGTQSLKAMLFDPGGGLVAIAKQPFTPEPYFSARPGWAEQHPEVFWEALCDACRRLWAEDEHYRERVAGVALTTQRATVINVDRQGRALRPAILWLDQRQTAGIPPVKGGWGALFKCLGLSDTIAYFQAEAEGNWIAAHQPDIWSRTHKYLLLSGYLTYRLVGEFVDSVGCQVGYLPFDYKKLRWASRRSWKWACVPVTPDMLPQLKPAGAELGRISSAAARQTGIRAGLPLIAAAADKACEVIGSGSLASSIGCLSFGTTATINVTHPRYIEPQPMMPAYPAALPGYHSLEVRIYRGYWMVSWFKAQFGHPERADAARQGIDAEALFEKLVDDVPPGAMGLMLQPYWSPGLKQPGPEAKGAVIGFGDVHSRAHLYRAILEGIAYALREGKEQIEKRTRIPISQLRVCGGGSQSRAAMQLTADIFGLPAARPKLYETSGLGAAVVAATGLGLYPDAPSAVRGMTRIGDVFEPNLQNHKLYEALYTDVYLKMYKRLKPFYHRIREITGYPA